jgi:hypothetical protein
VRNIIEGIRPDVLKSVFEFWKRKLLEFGWWIYGVNSTFWCYNVCLISLVCGESRPIMNTLYNSC